MSTSDVKEDVDRMRLDFFCGCESTDFLFRKHMASISSAVTEDERRAKR